MDTNPTAYQKISNEWLKKLINDNDVYTVFHYTSSDGFQGIMESKKIRFKDRFFMNDKSEGYYALELLKEYYSSVFPAEFQDDKTKNELLDVIGNFIDNFQTKIPFKVYAACFSINGDSLPMWNYYTKDQHHEGCNLCVNSLELSNSIIEKMWPNNNLHPYIFGHKVIYTISEQIEILKAFFDEIYKAIREDISYKKEFFDVIAKRTFMNRFESILERAAFIGAILKHPDFAFEEEYRIFIYPFDNDGKLYMFENGDVSRKFVEADGLLKPQIDIPFELSVITKITFSPTITQESEDRIKKMVHDEETMENAEFDKSIIPVRF